MHTGVAIGSTTTRASAYEQVFNERLNCPIEPVYPSGPDNVNPSVSFSPPITSVAVGQTATTTATVTPPSGNTTPISLSMTGGAEIVSPTGTFTESTTVIVKGVTAGSATLSATITNPDGGGTEDIGNPPDTFSVTAPVPAYLIVESDSLLYCSGCTTTVERDVLYAVMKSDDTRAGNIGIGENVSATGWSCTQTNPGFQSKTCSGGATTDNAGQFLDVWTLSADGYTPAGCGFTITDEWAACPSTNVGHLAGYAHTNAISINGVVNPPNTFPNGFRINP